MSEFFERLDKYIESKALINADDHLLIAVSGGMDSMVLLHYLKSKNSRIGVAHCNFGLRGEESLEDELFVKTYCEKHNIICHVKSFNTKDYSKEKGISIQMAARELRFEWFNDLLDAEGYNKIVTAHHKTDLVETVILNQLRGTGSHGMEGLKPISGKKIKPMLCLSKDEVQQITQEYQIEFREDSSNVSDKYSRNRLRHHVLPEFRRINPAFEETIFQNSEHISQANTFMEFYLNSIKQNILIDNGHEISINSEALMQYPEPQWVLFNMLSNYGFNGTQCKNIFETIGMESGRSFYSESHRLITHGKQLIIEPIVHLDRLHLEILESTNTLKTVYGEITFEITQDLNITASKNTAVLDFNKIVFPVILRSWKEGDVIKPLGMKGHKKVSDVLIDRKISISKKEKILVLESADQIVWIAGELIHEDFKIRPDTKKVWRLTLNPKIQNLH